MYESTATLRKETYTQDAALNVVAAYKDRTVYVKPKSVRASEFYDAARSGLKPSIVLVLSNPKDYDGEKVCLYNGAEYTIIRTYQKPERDALELTLEERTQNGG